MNLKSQSIFLWLSIIFIPIIIMLMPINKSPDEANHARMAWEISHKTNKNSIQWMDLVDSKTNETKVSQKQLNEVFKTKINLDKEAFEWNFKLSNIVHLPQLIGLWIGSLIYPSIGFMFILGRIFNAMAYILGMYFIIKYAKFAKLPMVLISLTPIMVQQAASLSYDVVNYLAIMFFFAVLTNYVKRDYLTKKNLILTIISIVLLYLTKKNNVLLLALLPFVFKGFSKDKEKWNSVYFKLVDLVLKFKWLLLSIGLICITLISFVFLHAKGGFLNFILIMINSLFNNSINSDLNPILGTGIFGNLGLLQFQLPLWLIFIDFIVLFILMYVEKTEINISSSMGNLSLILYIVQVICIVGGMYFLWTPLVAGPNASYSVGAQGRYFTPFLIYLYFFMVSRKDFVTIKVEKTDYLKKTVTFLLVFNFIIMLYLLICFYYIPSDPKIFFLDLKIKLFS